MKTPLALAITTIIFLAAAAPSTAQTASAEVTLKVPVNLTQFGPDLAKVRVSCDIWSEAITNGTSTGNHMIRKVQELTVSGGKVTTEVNLVFSFTALDNPVGKDAAVTCSLFGSTAAGTSWDDLSPTATNPSFKVSSGSGQNIGVNFKW
jgi:hypothetical protein